jgi:hypothetical protein
MRHWAPELPALQVDVSRRVCVDVVYFPPLPALAWPAAPYHNPPFPFLLGHGKRPRPRGDEDVAGRLLHRNRDWVTCFWQERMI